MNTAGKVQLNWTSQIRKLLQQMCPCSYNELLFHAIDLVPHAVARNSFGRRKQLAATVIGYACTITDGICSLRPAKDRFGSMKGTIAAMKQHGGIMPLDYMKKGTAKTYRKILLRLQWIEVQCDGLWQWIGPDDADYRVALELHRPRKGRSK